MNLRCFVGVWLVYSVQFNNSLEFEKERLSKGQLCSDSTIIKYTTPFKVWAHPLRLVLPLDLSQFLKDTSFSIYPALLFSDNMHFICGMNSDKIYKGCKPTWAGEIGELLNDALSESVDARGKKKKILRPMALGIHTRYAFSTEVRTRSYEYDVLRPSCRWHLLTHWVLLKHCVQETLLSRFVLSYNPSVSRRYSQ